MQKETKKNNLFEWTLVAVIIITTCIAVYESFMQKYSPGDSILSFFHQYGYLKKYPAIYEPSKGIWHPVGWTGSAMMVIMMIYSVRKRIALFESLGSLRHWLSFHMSLGIMGPILVTFHTTFKFGGIIATSFWCMIVTMVFGILGRYIYIQIPRNLSGTELETNEIDKMVKYLDSELDKYLGDANITDLFKEISAADEKAKSLNLINSLIFMIRTDIANLYKITHLKKVMKTRYRLTGKTRREIVLLLKKKAAIIRQKNFLATSHRLLHYWHVFHIPLAIVMFLIMFLHIIVYYLFGAIHHKY
ncbi:MAG: hypothetical protein HY097_07840 [Nitrospinae bacterium]|nr:hypothetical protein [Nitrospinota bacterium]